MILIIGATGFIGMYTVDQFLLAGYDVIATGRNQAMIDDLSKKKVKCISLDISKKEEFKKLPSENIEGVILLAGLLPANANIDITKDENANDYIDINVKGIINVLEYCRKNNIKKVISTTSYADVSKAWKKNYPISESEPRNFSFTGDHAMYIISKNAASDIMEYYNEEHGMQCAVFRLPPVYGVGPHSVIYVNGKYYKTGIQTFIENAEAGKDIEIWGDPKISRDIVYVKDVAKAFVQAIGSRKTKGLYNMTAGRGVTLEEQVMTVIDIFGKNSGSKIIYRPDLKNNTPSFLFSIDKANKDFGYVPQYLQYRDMMLDYKKELESGRWDHLIASRHKNRSEVK